MVFTLLLLFAQTVDARDFVLGPKQSINLYLKEDSTVWIENSNVVRVKELEDSLRVTAKNTGLTRIDIDQESHSVRVLPKTLHSTYQELREAPWIRRNTRIHFGKTLSLQAEIKDPTAFIETLSGLPPPAAPFQWRLRTSPIAKEYLKEKVEEHLLKSGLSPAAVYFSPHWFVALPTSLEKMKSRYRQALSAWGVDVIVDSKAVEMSPLIEIEIQIVEVKTGFLQRFGLQWPDRLSAALTPDAQLLDSVAVLHASENQGQSKILAAPKLLSRSGKRASFHSGGEIPILSGHLGREVIWKKHGIQLDFEPRVDLNGALNLKILTEVSSPDFSTSIDGIPGFVTNRMATDFTLKRPRTIMISGLVRKDKSKAQQGVPLVHRIPILGPLFGSRTENDNSSQLAIFVRPRIVEQDRAEQTGQEGHSRSR